MSRRTARSRHTQLVKGLAAVEAWEKEHGAFSEAEMQAALARVRAEIAVMKRRR